MNPVIRGVAVYVFILIIFRLMGKRTLSEVTTFDFVLLLIISETTTDALVGEDYSLMACFIMVTSLVTFDLLLTFAKTKWKKFDKAVDGAPLVIVDKGKLLQRRMDKSKVDQEDVMEAARLLHGLERLDQIKYAVLERDGSISIIPDRTKSD